MALFEGVELPDQVPSYEYPASKNSQSFSSGLAVEEPPHHHHQHYPDEAPSGSPLSSSFLTDATPRAVVNDSFVASAFESSVSYIVSSGPSFHVPKWLLPVSALSVVVGGTFCAMSLKFMNRQILEPCDGCEPEHFEAPYYQTFTQFIGDIIVGFLLYCIRTLKSCRSSSSPGKKSLTAEQPCRWKFWFIAAMMDLAQALCNVLATQFMTASSATIMRNFNVVGNAALSVIFFKRPLFAHQIYSIVILTASVVCVFVYGLTTEEPASNHANLTWLGAIFGLLTAVVSSFLFAYEEWLLGFNHCSIIYAVGVKGVCAGSVCLIVVIITHFTGVEDMGVVLYQMGLGKAGSTRLILGTIVLIFSTTWFVAGYMGVNRAASALQMVVLLMLRTVAVWIVELVVKWADFSGIDFAALLLMLLGAALYNYDRIVPKGSWKGDWHLRKILVAPKAKKPADADDQQH